MISHHIYEEIMKRLDAAGLQAGVIGEVVDRREWTLVLR